MTLHGAHESQLLFGMLSAPLGDGIRAKLAEMLAPSVGRDPDTSLDEVMDAIGSGDAQAWIAHRSGVISLVCVTQIITTASGPQCWIWQCAGAGMDDWLHFLAIIEGWAKTAGCHSMELSGRDGWERVLGWPRKAVVLRKEI